jgi:hypothetical protein
MPCHGLADRVMLCRLRSRHHQTDRSAAAPLVPPALTGRHAAIGARFCQTAQAALGGRGGPNQGPEAQTGVRHRRRSGAARSVLPGARTRRCAWVKLARRTWCRCVTRAGQKSAGCSKGNRGRGCGTRPGPSPGQGPSGRDQTSKDCGSCPKVGTCGAMSAVVAANSPGVARPMAIVARIIRGLARWSVRNAINRAMRPAFGAGIHNRPACCG